MRYEKINFILILFFLYCNVLSSQNIVSNSTIPSETHLMPDALNTNVNLFRGELQVSIPIYEYRTDHLRLPISLNYAVPKKVSNAYHPGWTGWGWQLSAGGSITRRIKGIPDDKAENERSQKIWPEYYNSTHTDIMEDDFSFNFCGYSGTFFNYKGLWIINCDKELWITCLWDTNNLALRKLQGFLIRTATGVSYYFGKGEASTELQDYASATVTWHLTKILAPEGDYIELNYENGDYICNLIYNSSTENVYHYEGNARLDTYSKRVPNSSHADSIKATDAFVRRKAYLKSITGGAVTVNFNRTQAIEKDYPETDLKLIERKYHNGINKNNLKYHKLSEIILTDAVTNRDFKKFVLNYTASPSDILKLLSVQEFGIQPDNTQKPKPAYRFEYDYQPNESTTFIGVLRKMSYPTGGFSLFEYYYHSYKNVFRKGDVGYRIERILSYSGENEVPLVTQYSYLFPDFTDSGQISREKHKTLRAEYYDGRYTVHIEKTSTNDLATWAIFDADQYGYSCVTETKSQGGFEQSAVRRYFINYNNNWIKDFAKFDHKINDETYLWNQIGKIVREEELSRGEYVKQQTTYHYWNTECIIKTYPRKTVFYLPINNTQSLGRENVTELHYRKYYPWRIVETMPIDSGTSTILGETVFTTEYSTGNKLCEETTDIYGNVYKTDYNYMAYEDAWRGAYKQFNLPHEIIRWKNGKVIAAEVIEYVNFSGCRKPAKRYVLEIKNPVTDYRPVSFTGANGITVDPRCKLVESYDYYPDSKRLQRYQQTGKEPVIYYWDDYGNVVAEIVGAEYNEIERIRPASSNRGAIEPRLDTNPLESNSMQLLRARLPHALITSYSYNVHGMTSVTSPNGQTQYVEYDAFGQPNKMLDDARNILQKIEYKYSIQ